jgi:hypothetical protein
MTCYIGAEVWDLTSIIVGLLGLAVGVGVGVLLRAV